MYVCMCILGFVMLPHAAPYSWLQLPQRQSAQKTKNKKQEKQEPTQNHYPFSVSLLFHRYFYISLSGTAKNHPKSPGKNHVTYPRKAVPVITGYGLSTSLLLPSRDGLLLGGICWRGNDRKLEALQIFGPKHEHRLYLHLYTI